MDTRKSVKVIPGVKYEMGVIKRQLKLKSESEVILYLREFYEIHRNQLTLVKHEQIKNYVQELHKQQSF